MAIVFPVLFLSLVVVWVVLTARGHTKSSLVLGLLLIIGPNFIWGIMYGYGRDWERKTLRRVEELIAEGHGDLAAKAIKSGLKASSGSDAYLGALVYQEIDELKAAQPKLPPGTATRDNATKIYAPPGDAVIVNVEIDPKLTLRIIVSHDGKMVVTNSPVPGTRVFDGDSSVEERQLAKIWKSAAEASHLPSGNYFLQAPGDVVGDITIVRSGNVKKYRITDDSNNPQATEALASLWKSQAYLIPW